MPPDALARPMNMLSDTLDDLFAGRFPNLLACADEWQARGAGRVAGIDPDRAKTRFRCSGARPRGDRRDQAGGGRAGTRPKFWRKAAADWAGCDQRRAVCDARQGDVAEFRRNGPRAALNPLADGAPAASAGK